MIRTKSIELRGTGTTEGRDEEPDRKQGVEEKSAY